MLWSWRHRRDSPCYTGASRSRISYGVDELEAGEAP